MKTLAVFDPLVEFDRFFENLAPVKGRMPLPGGNFVPLDVFVKDNEWVLRASLPGLKAEDIDLSIDKGVLTLRGELNFEVEHKDAKIYRREIASGTFVRSVTLPDDVDVNKAKATFDNGFVTLTLPRLAEDKTKVIKVPVKAIELRKN